MNDVIFNTHKIVSLSSSSVLELKQLAMGSARKRSRFCMHYAAVSLTHEMLLVFYQSTFIRPHRHPQGKTESYHVVEGEMIVYFFDDSGRVIKTIEMGEYRCGKPFVYRLSEPCWHMPVPLTEWLVYHETFTGPFDKNLDVEYANWAPEESNPALVQAYLARLAAERVGT